MAPEQIQYINAHGTSTPLNDKGETKAVKTAFGEHAKNLMMSSTKSMTGNLLGASGAVEAMVTALAVCHDFAPATVNFKVPDEECDLDIVPNEGRNVTIEYFEDIREIKKYIQYVWLTYYTYLTVNLCNILHINFGYTQVLFVGSVPRINCLIANVSKHIYLLYISFIGLALQLLYPTHNHWSLIVA